MGISSALTTGLSGLAANQLQLNVVGNNIANVNTVGYKSQTLDFQTQFAQTFSYGTEPVDPSGGTNPFQIGNGTTEASTSTDFNTGAQEITGVNTNLALQGDGFFVLKDSQQLFTRDGTFKLNSEGKLVNGDGLRVQGFAVDSNYAIIPGVVGDINIPIGSLTVAKATTTSTLDGNLNAGGAVASTATASTLDQPLYLAGSGAVSSTPPATTDLLTNITDASNTAYFQTGDVITLQASQAGRNLAAKSFTVGAGSTLGDLQSFLGGALGINSTSGINGSAAAPGVTDTTTGNHVSLDITGNTGSANDLTLSSSSLTIQRASATISPFTFTKNATADGESVFTTMQAYDSLGNTVNVGVTATLVSTSGSGTTWQFLATSPNGTNTGALTTDVVGQGTLTYNNFGQLTGSTGATVSVARGRPFPSPWTFRKRPPWPVPAARWPALIRMGRLKVRYRLSPSAATALSAAHSRTA
jgi:flagellar hook-basal body protein